MTAHERENSRANERRALEQLADRIGARVLDLLGRPADLQRVQVRQLWHGHYRVNVLTGPDAASVKVADSYFLEADGAGNILTASPRIGWRYQAVAAPERSGP